MNLALSKAVSDAAGGGNAGQTAADQAHPAPVDINLEMVRASGLSRSKCNDSILVYSFALKPGTSALGHL